MSSNMRVIGGGTPSVSLRVELEGDPSGVVVAETAGDLRRLAAWCDSAGQPGGIGEVLAEWLRAWAERVEEKRAA